MKNELKFPIVAFGSNTNLDDLSVMHYRMDTKRIVCNFRSSSKSLTINWRLQNIPMEEEEAY